MKRALALAATLSLLAATPPANYNAFGIAVLQRLAAQAHNQNVFISPVSLGVALAMTADGAAGETRAQLLHVLGASDANLAQANAALIASLESNHDAKVGIANAIWLRQDLPPRAAYVQLLERDYGAQARALHFGDPSAAAAINEWTADHTFGLIPELVDSTNPLDLLYLTNAVAFQADWSTPFDPRNTTPQPFTDAFGERHDVQMMSRSGTYETATLPSFRILRMPYGGGGYAAYILLPNGGTTDPLLHGLTAQSFERALQALQSVYLQISVPRFTARYDAGLNGVLESLGISDAFGPAADFSPMTSQRVRITNVAHEAYVRVDEKGTTAAAATSVEISLLAVRERAAPFVVDRPFAIALRDEHTGSLLFIGVINSITQ